MDHCSTVADSPFGTTFYLLADEAVFNAKEVCGVWVFVEDVPEAVVERVVLFVAYGEFAIGYVKGVAEVISDAIPVYFYDPIVKVFTVEQLLPRRLGRLGAAGGSTGE
jgi:hypothetical protein